LISNVKTAPREIDMRTTITQQSSLCHNKLWITCITQGNGTAMTDNYKQMRLTSFSIVTRSS